MAEEAKRIRHRANSDAENNGVCCSSAFSSLGLPINNFPTAIQWIVFLGGIMLFFSLLLPLIRDWSSFRLSLVSGFTRDISEFIHNDMWSFQNLGHSGLIALFAGSYWLSGTVYYFFMAQLSCLLVGFVSITMFCLACVHVIFEPNFIAVCEVVVSLLFAIICGASFLSWCKPIEDKPVPSSITFIPSRFLEGKQLQAWLHTTLMFETVLSVMLILISSMAHITNTWLALGPSQQMLDDSVVTRDASSPLGNLSRAHQFTHLFAEAYTIAFHRAFILALGFACLHSWMKPAHLDMHVSDIFLLARSGFVFMHACIISLMPTAGFAWGSLSSILEFLMLVLQSLGFVFALVLRNRAKDRRIHVDLLYSNAPKRKTPPRRTLWTFYKKVSQYSAQNDTTEPNMPSRMSAASALLGTALFALMWFFEAVLLVVVEYYEVESSLKEKSMENADFYMIQSRLAGGINQALMYGLHGGAFLAIQWTVSVQVIRAIPLFFVLNLLTGVATALLSFAEIVMVAISYPRIDQTESFLSNIFNSINLIKQEPWTLSILAFLVYRMIAGAILCGGFFNLYVSDSHKIFEEPTQVTPTVSLQCSDHYDFEEKKPDCGQSKSIKPLGSSTSNFGQTRENEPLLDFEDQDENDFPQKEEFISADIDPSSHKNGGLRLQIPVEFITTQEETEIRKAQHYGYIAVWFSLFCFALYVFLSIYIGAQAQKWPKIVAPTKGEAITLYDWNMHPPGYGAVFHAMFLFGYFPLHGFLCGNFVTLDVSRFFTAFTIPLSVASVVILLQLPKQVVGVAPFFMCTTSLVGGFVLHAIVSLFMSRASEYSCAAVWSDDLVPTSPAINRFMHQRDIFEDEGAELSVLEGTAKEEQLHNLNEWISDSDNE